MYCELFALLLNAMGANWISNTPWLEDVINVVLTFVFEDLFGCATPS